MFATTYLLQLRLRGISFVRLRGISSSSPTKKIHKFFLSTGDRFVYGGSVSSTGDQLFSKGCLDGMKNGPDRRGRRVRCGPAGRPAPGR